MVNENNVWKDFKSFLFANDSDEEIERKLLDIMKHHPLLVYDAMTSLYKGRPATNPKIGSEFLLLVNELCIRIYLKNEEIEDD